MESDVIRGAVDIAKVFGRSERWLRGKLADDPAWGRRAGIRRDEGGRLWAHATDLRQFREATSA